MIAGLSLILDPKNQHAGDMREIVQSFMEQHPHDPAADEFSQKEAAIVSVRCWPAGQSVNVQISTLYKRAEEAAEKQSRGQYRFETRSNVSIERGTPAVSAKGGNRDERDEIVDDVAEHGTGPDVKHPVPKSESMRSSMPSSRQPAGA